MEGSDQEWRNGWTDNGEDRTGRKGGNGMEWNRLGLRSVAHKPGRAARRLAGSDRRWLAACTCSASCAASADFTRKEARPAPTPDRSARTCAATAVAAYALATAPRAWTDSRTAAVIRGRRGRRRDRAVRILALRCAAASGPGVRSPDRRSARLAPASRHHRCRTGGSLATPAEVVSATDAAAARDQFLLDSSRTSSARGTSAPPRNFSTGFRAARACG